MKTLSLLVSIPFLLTGVAGQQDQDPSKVGARGAAPSARQRTILLELRRSAAAARFTALRTSVTQVLGDLHDMIRDDDSDDVLRFCERAALQQIAEQFETFIEEHADMAYGQAARALLARIYVRLDRVPDAARVLEKFDPKTAEVEAILEAVVAAHGMKKLVAQIPLWLTDIVDRADTVEERFDAVFVATRMKQPDLAVKLLDEIRTEAKDIEEKADVLVCEAELLARLSRTHIVPIGKVKPRPIFSVSPLGSPVIEPTAVGTPSWTARRATGKGDPRVRAAGTPAPKHYREDLIPPPERGDGSPPSKLAGTPIYAKIRDHAMHGIKSLRAWARLGDVGAEVAGGFPEEGISPDAGPGPARAGTFVPGTPDEHSVEPLARALLHMAIHEYPGTRAARIAAAKLHARQLRRGVPPMPIHGTGIDAQPYSLAALHGKVVLIDFWSTYVPHCIQERETLAALHRAYRHAGFEILSINCDRARDGSLVRSVLDRYEIAWPQIFEGRGAHSDIARCYGVEALPARILIGRDGRIVEIEPANLTMAALRTGIPDALRAPVPGAPVAQPDDPPVGVMGIALPRYLGPPIRTKAVPVEGGASTLAIDSVATVPNGGYRYACDGVQVIDGVAHVKMSLIAPRTPDKRTGFKRISQRIPFNQKVNAVKVLVRHVVGETKYDGTPGYYLDEVVPVGIGARRRYVGPPLRCIVLRPGNATGSPDLEVRVNGSPGHYDLQLIGVRSPDVVMPAAAAMRQPGDEEPTEARSQVMLRLIAKQPTRGHGAEEPTEARPVRVKIAKTMTREIDVLVAFGDNGYALVETVRVR